MPSYDYYCEANGQTYEVKHSMSEKITNWGELCKKLNMDLSDIQATSPVKKLITGGNFVHSSALRNPDAPACATGSCCPGGSCGIN